MFDQITKSIEDVVSKEITSGLSTGLMSKEIQSNLNSIFKQMQGGSESLLKDFPSASSLLDGLTDTRAQATQADKAQVSEKTGGFLNKAIEHLVHEIPAKDMLKPIENLNQSLEKIMNGNNEAIDELIRNFKI